MEAIIPVYNRNENETHKVVYIEYQDGLPHLIYTQHKNHVEWWDAFYERGDKNSLMLYNAGGGGQTVQAPQFIEKFKGGAYWKSDKVEFNGTPKNATKLDSPLVLESYFNKSNNPFEVGEITYSSQYCNVCERKNKGCGWSVDYCDEHTYTDDNGDLRYFNQKYV